MALRRIINQTGSSNYLKVVGVNIFTESGVTVTGEAGNEVVNRLTANVTFNVYRSAESRWNGLQDEFEVFKTESRGFSSFPEPPEGFIGTDYQKAIAIGYVLLKSLEEFGASVWEDC